MENLKYKIVGNRHCLFPLLFIIFFLGWLQFAQDNSMQNTQETQGVQKRKTWKNSPERIQVANKNKENENSAPFSFIFQQDISSPLTVIRLLIAGGKKSEPLDRKGLAFLTTRLAVEIPENSDVIKLMTLGSSISADVEGDYSSITITCLSENLAETLKIFSRTFMDPLFSSLRISTIKKNMVYQQKNEEDNTELLMEREYFNIFLENNGYGGSIFGLAEGNPNSLEVIKKKDIENFYNTYFNRSHISIVVISDLIHSEIEPIIKKYFQTLALVPGEPVQSVQEVGPSVQEGQPKEEFRNDIHNEKREYYFKKENIQSLVSLGALLPGMSPRHFVCAYMLENLLGGGIGSRIWPLREEMNLAYSLKAKAIQLKDAGIMWIYLKTDSSRKERAFGALKEILSNLYKNGISEEEFFAVKVRTRAHFMRNNETKEMRTFYLGLFERIGPGFEFIENFFSAVDTLTLADFNAYIQQVLKPGILVNIIIGPEKLAESAELVASVGD